jgi:hypothetical protein
MRLRLAPKRCAEPCTVTCRSRKRWSGVGWNRTYEDGEVEGDPRGHIAKPTRYDAAGQRGDRQAAAGRFSGTTADPSRGGSASCGPMVSRTVRGKNGLSVGKGVLTGN